LQNRIFVHVLKLKLNWDAVGAFASIACAIHCAVFPLLLGAMPFLHLFENLYFEWGMIIFAAIVGAYALTHGFNKHHKNPKFLILFSIGILLLLAKQFFAKEAEIYFLLLGVPCILWAHYGNYKLCHKSVCTSAHHKH
jgi:hypothetical protein